MTIPLLCGVLTFHSHHRFYASRDGQHVFGPSYHIAWGAMRRSKRP